MPLWQPGCWQAAVQLPARHPVPPLLRPCPLWQLPVKPLPLRLLPGQAENAKVKAEFTVTGADGESQTFTLEVTDGEKLSDALVEAGLISEEEAAAGFVTTVNGETADWDKDQAWWCLNDATGEMTTVGVADIALHDGDSYAFVYTK